MRISLRAVWELTSTAIVVIAAMAALSLYVLDRETARPPTETALSEVEDWRNWAGSGIRMGLDDAPMVVSAFMDFQCPFCRDLVSTFDSLNAEFGEDVAIEFHHFPLVGHRSAVPAAIATECADRQGRFEEMYRSLFAQMDSIGKKDWEAFAEEADIADLPAFRSCVRLPQENFPRISAGRELGKSIGVSGTPKIWVNGDLLTERSLVEFRRRARKLGL